MAHTAEEVTLTKALLYKIINQILLSVEDLHSINIIHRDIKPSNILVTKDYKAYLIDFGIARFHSDTLDADTTKSGTKGFASPEQYGFQQTDFRSDIYSIGKTIDSLVKSNNINGFKKVISKSISFDPNNRYSSVFELKRAVNIGRFNIVFCLLLVVILVFAFICFCLSKTSETNGNIINTNSDKTNFNTATTEAISEISTEITTAVVTTTETTTTKELTTQASKITKPASVSTPKAVTKTQPKASKTNKIDSEKTETPENKNTNILKFQDDKFYFKGLIVPDGTDFMEILGNEPSKTCSIEINNTCVTVECVKNNSTLNVYLSDTLGHKDSLELSFTEEQLKTCSFPQYHNFNVYIYFLDYNNDGNTEIFVNFTDMTQPTYDSGELITLDYKDGSKPYVLKNWNMLRLVEHNSANGFYIYKEVMLTYHSYKFKVYTSGIFCDEYLTIFKPHDGIITEELM